jgi:hypothetical protein
MPCRARKQGPRKNDHYRVPLIPLLFQIRNAQSALPAAALAKAEIRDTQEKVCEKKFGATGSRMR